jgi:hypothetical protein
MNDLVTAVKSKEFIEDELKEFYTLTRPFYNFFNLGLDLLVDEATQLKRIAKYRT